MEIKFLQALAGAAGIGGLGVGALILIFRQILAKSLFPRLKNIEAYRLWMLMVFACWTVALAGIGSYTYLERNKSAHSGVQQSLSREAVAEWVRAASEARANGTIHPSRPLPDSLAQKRATFERWWHESGSVERRAAANELLFNALSLNSRLYRLSELQSETKPNALFWNEQCLTYFEQMQDRRFVAESLLDRAALYLELSQIEHTDPERFRRIAEDGDAVMARAAALAGPDQQAEAFRIWSRFYYNLARPADGLLSSTWNNNYLSLAYTRSKQAHELKPDDIKNVTQLARSVQRFAANPPQDRDAWWITELRRVQQLMRTAYTTASESLKTPTSRIPPLDVLGVITMDAVRREWTTGNQTPEKGEMAAKELEQVALVALREAWALIRHTEWAKDYAFDLNYDLGRAEALLVQIRDVQQNQSASDVFANVLQSMGTAATAATSRQLRSARIAVEQDPTLALLRDDRRKEVRAVFTVN
jgi:hypothetical protein